MAVSQVRHALLARFDSNPLLMIEEPMQALLGYTIDRLAEFVGAEPESLFFVPNATYQLTF